MSSAIAPSFPWCNAISILQRTLMDRFEGSNSDQSRARAPEAIGGAGRSRDPRLSVRAAPGVCASAKNHTRGGRGSRGRRRARPSSASSSWAASKSAASPRGGATSCRPTGLMSALKPPGQRKRRATGQGDGEGDGDPVDVALVLVALDLGHVALLDREGGTRPRDRAGARSGGRTRPCGSEGGASRNRTGDLGGISLRPRSMFQTISGLSFSRWCSSFSPWAMANLCARRV